MENEVIKCIRGRRSIRNYDEREVPDGVIDEIITAGRYAPSPEDRQPWKFIVVTDRDAISFLSDRTKGQIGKMLKQKRKWKKKFKELNDEQMILFLQAIALSKEDRVFHDAPAVIFVVTRDDIFNDVSCACAAQNMMLAAQSMGIGSCWVGFANSLEWDGEAMQKIGMPEGHHIAASIVFGYPENEPKATPRKPTSDIIKWIN